MFWWIHATSIFVVEMLKWCQLIFQRLLPKPAWKRTCKPFSSIECVDGYLGHFCIAFFISWFDAYKYDQSSDLSPNTRIRCTFHIVHSSQVCKLSRMNGRTDGWMHSFKINFMLLLLVFIWYDSPRARIVFDLSCFFWQIFRTWF